MPLLVYCRRMGYVWLKCAGGNEVVNLDQVAALVVFSGGGGEGVNAWCTDGTQHEVAPGGTWSSWSAATTAMADMLASLGTPTEYTVIDASTYT